MSEVGQGYCARVRMLAWRRRRRSTLDMTKEEVSHVHREDFYGALKKNDLEKLSQIYSDDYMLVRVQPSRGRRLRAAVLVPTKSSIWTGIQAVRELLSNLMRSNEMADS